MSTFYDSHLHLMSLSDPDMISFFDALNSYLPDFLTSGSMSPAYILTPQNRNPRTMVQRVGNLITAMDGSIEYMLSLLEKDLRGELEEREPFLKGNTLTVRDMEFDSFTLCPLIMDFTPVGENRFLYPAMQQDRLQRSIENMIEAKERSGMFTLKPFLGITPKAHSEQEVKELLKVCETHFSGIKLYPPLGFDPDPEDSDEKKKVEILFSFAEEHNLPVITHCDDQGFRTFPTKQVWKWSDPATWQAALERHPALKLDFAHFGYRYALRGLDLSQGIGMPRSNWFYSIISLMEKYESVYADLSYSGVSQSFYKELNLWFEKPEMQKLKERILFGSDWSINLMKIPSYSDYISLFEQSPFSSEDLKSFCSINPERFLTHV